MQQVRDFLTFTIVKEYGRTSISFFKKLAGRLASTTVRTPMTIIPHDSIRISVH